MKVSFELSLRDIRYFRERLREVRRSGAASDEPSIISGAEDLIREALVAEPGFAVERGGQLSPHRLVARSDVQEAVARAEATVGR